MFYILAVKNSGIVCKILENYVQHFIGDYAVSFGKLCTIFVICSVTCYIAGT